MQLSTRLFRKPDQINSILSATHAFWNSHDHLQICKLLNKCLKTSSQILDRNARIECLLNILHKGIYYKKQSCDGILDVLGGVLERLEANIQEAERDDSFQLSTDSKNLYAYIKSEL